MYVYSLILQGIERERGRKTRDIYKRVAIVARPIATICHRMCNKTKKTVAVWKEEQSACIT